MIIGKLVPLFDHAFYPRVSGNWDDAMLRERVLSRLGVAKHILGLGAGAGIVRQMDMRATAATIHGVDLDRRVRNNPYLHHGCIGNAEALPYADESFDAVVADNLLEHLREPAFVFAEIRGVLRPGGLFHAKTPNRRHYVPLLARMTPHSVHCRVAMARGRRSDDTFPTHYRANTCGTIRRLATGAGLVVDALQTVEGRPEYCRIHPALYVCGIAYERAVNSSRLLAPPRVVILVTLRKP